MNRESPVRRCRDIAPGDALPPLEVPVTARLIVGGAIASRDYQNVHHDHGGAVALGASDIFMNILTTNGLAGRYVTGWAGPGALLNKLSIRLGVPCHPGDTLCFSGEVLARDEQKQQVELQIRGVSGRGEHVSGTATVTLPPQAAA